MADEMTFQWWNAWVGLRMNVSWVVPINYWDYNVFVSGPRYLPPARPSSVPPALRVTGSQTVPAADYLVDRIDAVRMRAIQRPLGSVLDGVESGRSACPANACYAQALEAAMRLTGTRIDMTGDGSHSHLPSANEQVLDDAYREVGRTLEVTGTLLDASMDPLPWAGTLSACMKSRLGLGGEERCAVGLALEVGLPLLLTGIGIYAPLAIEEPHVFRELSRGTLQETRGLGVTRGLWRITDAGSDRVAIHKFWGKFSRHRTTGLWWSKDMEGHGQVVFKVFKEEPGGLRWFKDADAYGDFVAGKHKGPRGRFIPWSELRILP